MAAGELLLDLGGLGSLSCEELVSTALEGISQQQEKKSLTSTGRTDENHSNFLGRDGRASSSRLEGLDARVKRADDALELLQLIFDETHCCDCGRMRGTLGGVLAAIEGAASEKTAD